MKLGQADLARVLVVVAVALIIGVFVFSTISTSISRNGLSAAANTSLDTVDTNTYTAFTLAAIVVIVIAAAAIIRNLGLI